MKNTKLISKIDGVEIVGIVSKENQNHPLLNTYNRPLSKFESKDLEMILFIFESLKKTDFNYFDKWGNQYDYLELKIN